MAALEHAGRRPQGLPGVGRVTGWLGPLWNRMVSQPLPGSTSPVVLASDGGCRGGGAGSKAFHKIGLGTEGWLYIKARETRAERPPLLPK